MGSRLKKSFKRRKQSGGEEEWKGVNEEAEVILRENK